MGIYSIKPTFQRSLVGLRDFCINKGVSADFLTGTAVLLSIAGGLTLAATVNRPLWLWLTPVLAMARITLNALDGMVATATGTARHFGELLNESADRVSDIAWFVGIALASNELLALSALIIVLLASYVGTAAKAAGGRRQYGGLMGKADRMILLSITAIAAFFAGTIAFNWFLYLVIAGSLLTAVQRLIAASRDLAAERRG